MNGRVKNHAMYLGVPRRLCHFSHPLDRMRRPGRRKFSTPPGLVACEIKQVPAAVMDSPARRSLQHGSGFYQLTGNG
jgi:hypothetical protein